MTPQDKKKVAEGMVCFFFGHKYRLKRKITRTIRELKCSRCGKEFGMNDDTQSVLPMDFELTELHNEILNPHSHE
jgi:hypothetical protein